MFLTRRLRRREENLTLTNLPAVQGEAAFSLPVYIFPIFYSECFFHNGKIIKLKLFVFDIFLIKKVINVH